MQLNLEALEKSAMSGAGQSCHSKRKNEKGKEEADSVVTATLAAPVWQRIIIPPKEEGMLQLL